MGFRATDNKHLPDASFEEPAYLRSPDTGLGSQIGSKLDAALAKLYTWCSANNVPIMAHTSHSFGPNSDYEGRADPIFWADVIKQNAFPQLKAVGYDDAQIEGIMFRNAVRFLGLGKAEFEKFGEKSTRGRLEKFYAAHNLSSDWMTAFD